MPRLRGDERNEGKLRSTISIAKGMNRVELGNEVSSSLGKGIGRAVTQESPISQPPEGGDHMPMDVLRVTERTWTFADPDGAIASGPTIDVLKKMTMELAVVTNAESTGRERLVRSLRSHSGFKILKRDGISDARLVLEDCRAAIAIRIGKGSVCHSAQFAPVPYLSLSMRLRSAPDVPSRSKRLNCTFISFGTRIPSTALIFSKSARPRMKPRS